MANFGNTTLPKIGGTQTVQMEKAFRKKFRDQSIIPLITNSDWKGRFRGVGTEIKIPVLPVLTTQTAVFNEDGSEKAIVYQTPASTEETFKINRERYWGIHMIQEDELFADFNITNPILDEQAKVMSEDVESELLGDIATKAHAKNKGDNTTGKAGFVSGTYAIGSASNPTLLFKSDAAADKSTATGANVNKLAAPDFMAAMASTLTEQPGGKVGSWRIVIPTVVANLLQTSELKQAELTGDATSTLRKSVTVLGNIAGMDVIVSDKVPYQAGDTSAANVYPIYAMDTTAITFAEEVVIKDKIQDKDVWGDFHRCKMIYDWFVRYPERFAVGYVKIG